MAHYNEISIGDIMKKLHSCESIIIMKYDEIGYQIGLDKVIFQEFETMEECFNYNSQMLNWVLSYPNKPEIFNGVFIRVNSNILHLSADYKEYIVFQSESHAMDFYDRLVNWYDLNKD